MDNLTVIASGLRFPEGPVAMPDGSVILVEIEAGRITRVQPDGSTETVAETGGGPNGLALGPDGKLYCCNNGGFVYVEAQGLLIPHGTPAEYRGGSIQRIDIATGARRVFASGLRNPVGMAWEPATGALWTVVNERDELGDDLVPDYLTSVRRGAFYGWPYSYYGQHVDVRVQPPRPDLVARAIAPDYALGSHVAPLGLAFARGACQVGWWRHCCSSWLVVVGIL